MKRIILKSVLLITMAISLLSFDLPTAWFKAGNKPKSYDMGIDKTVLHNSKSVATIKSIDKRIKGFGTLMQMCKPDKFIGKRVKMTGYLKTENVKDWAGLWLRVDQANSQKPLSFDNMQDRAVKGTTEWTKYEIVLDVPANASAIAFGALLSGTGQVWLDNFKFEVVDNLVKPTAKDIKSDTYIQNEPTNLEFVK